MIKIMRRRLIYLFLTLTLIFIEVLIALFVHDSFIRPYVGDVLIVIVLYCLVRIFIPKHFYWLPLAVFIVACAVEVLQLLRLTEVLGIADNRFLSILIGSTFDIKDIACYAVGCLILGVYEFVQFKKN